MKKVPHIDQVVNPMGFIYFAAFSGVVIVWSLYEAGSLREYLKNDMHVGLMGSFFWLLVVGISGLLELRKSETKTSKLDLGLYPQYGEYFILIMSAMLGFIFLLYGSNDIYGFIKDHIIMVILVSLMWIIYIYQIIRNEFFSYRL